MEEKKGTASLFPPFFLSSLILRSPDASLGQNVFVYLPSNPCYFLFSGNSFSVFFMLYQRDEGGFLVLQWLLLHQPSSDPLSKPAHIGDIAAATFNPDWSWFRSSQRWTWLVIFTHTKISVHLCCILYIIYKLYSSDNLKRWKSLHKLCLHVISRHDWFWHQRNRLVSLLIKTWLPPRMLSMVSFICLMAYGLFNA